MKNLEAFMFKIQTFLQISALTGIGKLMSPFHRYKSNEIVYMNDNYFGKFWPLFSQHLAKFLETR
jgi:hypothetical protein